MPRKVELSGAEKRKRAKEKRIAALVAELTKLGWEPTAAAPRPGAPQSSDPERPAWAEEFEDAFDFSGVDLDDPQLAMRCVRRAQLIAFRQRATTPTPTPEQLAVWKGIETQSKAIGATRMTSELEDIAAKVERLLSGTRQTTAAKATPTTSLPRPPTARGGARSRGPQLVDRPPPGDGSGQ